MRIDEIFVGVVIFLGAASTTISYYRERKRNDKELGKGWRKRVDRPFD
jgi:hypothetical protein